MVRTTKTKEYLKEAKKNGEEEPELTPKGQKPRTLTPEHLEKLKLAREKAREAQIRNTAERKLKKEKVVPEVVQTKSEKIDLSTNEKILQKPVIEEPIFDLESDEEPEVVIKKEKKKKPKKKPVVIVEQESDSESDDGESNVIYIKKRSNKKKVELAPVPIEPVIRQQPIEPPQFQYPRNPFYSMPFRMI
jgi:hypothetical protein